MKITETVLLKEGFEKKCLKSGCFYVKGEVGVVYNDMWLPCNVDTGVPCGSNVCVETIEDLYKLAKLGGKSI